MNIKKILVYSNGELIGDAIYKLNFLFNLKNNFPKSKIIWLVANKTAYETVLKEISRSFIDQIISIGYGKKFWNDFVFMPKAISNLNVDIIIDTQKSFFRSMLIKKIPHKIFVTDSFHGLFSNIKKNSLKRQLTLNEQLLDHISCLKKHLNSKLIYKDFQLAPKKNIQLIVDKLFSKHKKYIGYSVSAGDKNKIWPIKNFINLAKFFSKAGYVPTFFIGPDEKKEYQYLKKYVPGAFFPEVSIKRRNKEINGIELAVSVANKMQCCIANDSGTGHIISLSNTQLISLFSKHRPEKYRPLTKKLTIIDSKYFGGKKSSEIPYNYVKKTLADCLDKLN